MKILIVEDNSDMRDLLSIVVERMSYVPVLARHGKEGLEKAIIEKPRLILMDMMMPVMDGREAARALRANPDTKNIPILATTALFRPHELKTCLEAGCNGYIVKPFNFLDLQTKIRELLESCSEEQTFNWQVQNQGSLESGKHHGFHHTRDREPQARNTIASADGTKPIA